MMDTNVFIDTLLSTAKAAGLNQCEVYYSEGDVFKVNVFNGEIDDYSASASRALSFRALVDGKMGYASTRVFDEDAIGMLIASARENAQLLEDEDAQFLYAGDNEYAQLPGVDQAAIAVLTEDKIALARALDTAARKADARITNAPYNMVQTAVGLTRIVNTLGLNVCYQDNYVAAMQEVIAKDGEAVNTGFGLHVSRTWDAETLLNNVAKMSVGDAVGGLNAASVPAGSYAVVLANRAMADLLETFTGAFSAERAQKGLSLLNQREGSVIAAQTVTIWDDPHLINGLACAPFDAEGVATRKKAVVDRGTLTTLLHNLKTAHKAGIKTTGNASKASFAASMAVAPSNFYIRPGENSHTDVLKSAQNGLYITELQGLHSGANPISGDFSLAVKGYRIAGGVLAHPVANITMAGNFFKVLSDIAMIGDDLFFNPPSGTSSVGAPSVLLPSMDIAG